MNLLKKIKQFFCKHYSIGSPIFNGKYYFIVCDKCEKEIKVKNEFN